MEKFLNFLQGKKGVIASIIGAITAYLVAKGYIGEAEVILIGSVNTALFGMASHLTYKLHNPNN